MYMYVYIYIYISLSFYLSIYLSIRLSNYLSINLYLPVYVRTWKQPLLKCTNSVWFGNPKLTYRFDRKSITGCSWACFDHRLFTRGLESMELELFLALLRNLAAKPRIFFRFWERTFERALPNLKPAGHGSGKCQYTFQGCILSWIGKKHILFPDKKPCRVGFWAFEMLATMKSNLTTFTGILNHHFPWLQVLGHSEVEDLRDASVTWDHDVAGLKKTRNIRGCIPSFFETNTTQSYSSIKLN